MSYVIGCLVASIGFVLNRALFRRIGYRTIVTASPALEELLKTVPAYFIGTDILAVHVVFGLIEGVYDYCQDRSRLGLLAGCLSLIGHFLFGLATVVAFMFSASLWLSLAVGVVLHLVWNAAVVRFF